MVDDHDFTGYVAARWPSLVRTVVLLGCPLELAPDVVTTGLGRCRRGWREATEHDDVEVVVHRALLDAWGERRQGTWWSSLHPRTEDEWPLPDLAALDRLTPQARAGLVLRRYSSLNPSQAVVVAGREAGESLPDTPDGPTLRALGESVVVLAPPHEDELVADVAGRGRRRRLAVMAGVLAAAVVVGGGTWWANRSPDEVAEKGRPAGLASVKTTPAPNTAYVAWFAEGLLHLSAAKYAVPGIRQVASLSNGAVYGDAEGMVVVLTDDGSRERIGTKDPRTPLVASDADGLVAWVDPNGAVPRLLVYDLSQAQVILDLDLPPSASRRGDVPDTRPLAFDAGDVFFSTSGGWGSVAVGRPEREQLGVEALYDVASGRRIYQIGDNDIALQQPLLGVTRVVPGRGGELSADGIYALTRNPADGTVLVYKVRSGKQVDVAPPFAGGVVDAVLSPAEAITYLTVDPDTYPPLEGSHGFPVEAQIVTCQLDDGACETTVTFTLRSEGPFLAH